MYQSIDNKINLDFLLYFFKTSKGKDLLGLASPGGQDRHRTRAKRDFQRPAFRCPHSSSNVQSPLPLVLWTASLIR